MILVTGGGGFLGYAIVQRLRSRGYPVRSFSRQHYPALDALGTESMTGSLDDAAAVDRAVEGCDAVFHVAAKAGVWGTWDSYARTNIVGTQNILASCRRHHVRDLIFTSSPSVTFAGVDQNGVDESEPYPIRYLTAYPATKAAAERLVLAANGDTLRTVALRPHLIWGPGDPHLIPRIVERAKQGRLRRIGTRPNLVDTTFVDNAVDAHLNAYDTLQTGTGGAGRAYFISNGEPLPVWDFINAILARHALPPVVRTVPTGVAVAAGAVLEAVYRVLGRQSEPPMTRFVARQLSTAHWFDLSAARRDLGYTPRVTIAEGMQRIGGDS